MASQNSHLPRLLCLHGAGSSSAIFRIQIRKILQALKDEFRFVFVEAPFKSSPGPGMFPTFEQAGPFYRWHCDSSASSAFDITDSEIAAERRTVRERLTKALLENDGTPFVGIVAFSQGTRVATGFLLDWARQQGQQGSCSPLRLAVLFSGTYPPLPVSEDGVCMVEDTAASPSSGLAGDEFAAASEDDEDDEKGYSSEPEAWSAAASTPSSRSSVYESGRSTPFSDRLTIPSVHVHGLQDPWLPEGRDLRLKHYDPTRATAIEFQGGHHIPTAQKDINEIVKAIRVTFDSDGGRTC
ncbi:MAG: hypothetical protein Q9190_000228 [Brigantiaea leucoxantha]